MNHIVVISVFLSLAYFLQENVAINRGDVYQEITNDETIRSGDMVVQNQIPEYDFLIINNRGSEVIFTASISRKDINDAIERTRFMSAIPPTTITLYNKGRVIKDMACGLVIPISKRQKVTMFTKKFDNLKQYQRKKTKLTTSKKRVYFLEEEKEYYLTWFEY